MRKSQRNQNNYVMYAGVGERQKKRMAIVGIAEFTIGSTGIRGTLNNLEVKETKSNE